MKSKIEAIVQSPPFGAIDVHFAKLMQKFSGGNDPEVLLASALVSLVRSQGHICLNLPEFIKQPRLSEIGEVRVPALKTWKRKLQDSRVVGRPGDFRPLILDDAGRLYLHRYWDYEQNLARQIKARLRAATYDEKLLREGLARYFPQPDSDTNWQKVAAFAAVTRAFCVVSGGPGTGKTSTVLKILALLLEQSKGKARIALTAPTGKAASRLQETIDVAKANLPCNSQIKDALPTSASTIHRLLGTIPDSPYFRHDADNLLPYEVVVVDEASMVDLALMTKLFEAIRPQAHVILLGDKDQLSSVEAGAVLGDICGSAWENRFSNQFCTDYQRISGEALPVENSGAGALLADHNIQLQKNYRFGGASEIFQLSTTVRNGAADESLAVLGAAKEQLRWLDTSVHATLENELKQRVIDGFTPALKATNPVDALKALNQFRILGAVRSGPFGVTELNQTVETILTGEGLIDNSAEWYVGRPIMVTQNDYSVGLFNGDVGIIGRDHESGSVYAFFVGTDNQLRKIAPIRLPAHETVYAMTVHKSQGSEFDNILFILPDRDSPVLTRELIYTGITRARSRVELWANERLLGLALQRRVQRWSGLPDLLTI